MNIGIVLSKSPRYSETFFISKIKGLQHGGHNVILFVQSKDTAFDLCQVQVGINPSRNPMKLCLNGLKLVFSMISYPIRFSRFIKRERKSKRGWNQILKNCYLNAHILKSDLDWLHFGFSTMAFQSEHVAKAIKAKMAVSIRGFDMDVVPLKRSEEYRLIWQNVDKVHSLSNYLMRKARKLGLKEATPYQIITPAIDLTNASKREYAQQDGPIKLVTVARLHWIKGLNYILEALSILKRDSVDFTYSIVGEGPEMESLKFAIHQLELNDEIELVGALSHQETINYLKSSDIYIQYSLSEGFCNALLEAQGHGLLCIASDGGALRENILDSETGWIVPKCNPEALVAKIKEVISLPIAKKNEIVKNAQIRIRNEFRLERQRDLFNRFYE